MNILASNGVETPPTGVIGTIHRLLIFSSKPLRMLLMTGFAWYNLRPYHTIAISVNLISNAFVQAFSGHSDAYEYCQQFQIAQFVIDFLYHRRIYTYNHPLPKSVKTQVKNLQTGPTALNLALLTIFGLGLMQASFAVLVASVCDLTLCVVSALHNRCMLAM